MKFQDPSMHGSKVTGGIKKGDTYMNELTRQAKSNMPHQLFQSWGIHMKIYSKLLQFFGFWLLV